MSNKKLKILTGYMLSFAIVIGSMSIVTSPTSDNGDTMDISLYCILNQEDSDEY